MSASHRPLRASRLSPAHHALIVVLSVIAVSLGFGLLQVIDVAISGALRPHSSPIRQAALVVAEPQADGEPCPMDAMLVDVPSASAEAINL